MMGHMLGKKVRFFSECAPSIWCPGCNSPHIFPTDNSNVINGQVHKWTFNNDGDRPTFTPSMNCSPDRPDSQCHSFVTDGKIRFLSDCYHGLKGQTVDLPDWPEDKVKYYDWD